MLDCFFLQFSLCSVFLPQTKLKGTKYVAIIHFIVLNLGYLCVRLIYSRTRTSELWLLGRILLATRFNNGSQAKNSFCICQRLHFKWLWKYLQNSVHSASLPAKPRIRSIWPFRTKSDDLCYRESQSYLYRDQLQLIGAFHLKIYVSC